MCGPPDVYELSSLLLIGQTGDTDWVWNSTTQGPLFPSLDLNPLYGMSTAPCSWSAFSYFAFWSSQSHRADLKPICSASIIQIFEL